MKYREPISNEIIDVPDSVVKNEREKQVLIYDIVAFENDQEDIAHWGYVSQLMTEELGWDETPDSVRSIKDRITRRVRKEALTKTINNDLARDVVFRERNTTIVDRTALAKQWLGSQYTSQTRKTASGSILRRVLVVSDYHGTIHPFIQHALLTEEYELCIHAGDILDQWSMHQSRINGTSLTLQEKETFLDEEIQEMRAWFELLDAETRAQHIVLAGNHDVRMEATFVRLLAPILRHDSLMVRMFRTPLELLTEGLENVELGNRGMVWEYPDGDFELAAKSKFLFQLGDVLVSHMNFTGKQPGTAVSRLWQWVQDYRLPLGLSNIRLCLQAHTHSLMLDKNCQGGHVNLVETGCALKATALGYGLVYNGNWTPSAVGYVTFTQYDENGSWKTDLSSVQLHGVS